MLKFKCIESKWVSLVLSCISKTWSTLFLIFFLVYLIPASQANDLKYQKGGAMVPLKIDLQSGFLDDTVVLKANNQEIFHKKGISTDYAIGRTDSIEIQVPKSLITIKITVPSRQLSDSVVLEISGRFYLGISILDDKIKFKTSNEMFLYY